MEGERRTSTEENEESHYRRVIEAFDQYRRYSLATNNRRRKDLHRLPLEDQSLLREYPAKLAEVDDRIRRNADVLDEIVFKAELAGLGPSSALDPHLQLEQASDHLAPRVSALDAEKVRSTLRQLVRDWSSLGSAERKHATRPSYNGSIGWLIVWPSMSHIERRSASWFPAVDSLGSSGKSLIAVSRPKETRSRIQCSWPLTWCSISTYIPCLDRTGPSSSSSSSS